MKNLSFEESKQNVSKTENKQICGNTAKQALKAQKSLFFAEILQNRA